MTETNPGTGTGSLSILDHTGHTSIRWDAANPESARNAAQTFADLQALGYLAYRMDEDGKGEVIATFDPNAGEIFLAPALAGG